MSYPRSALFCALLSALLPAAADASLIHRDQLDAARQRGLEVVEDYGAVLWMRPASSLSTDTGDYALELAGRRFDPASETRAHASVYGSGPALRLVQFDAPARPEWLEDLKAAGIQPLQYVEPFAYVVWASAPALQGAARTQSKLRFAGDFLPEYKTATVADGIKRGELEWQLMLYRGARVDLGQLLASGAQLVERADTDAHFELARVRVTDAASVERLSRIPGVYAIHPVPRDGGLRGELQHQLSANNLGGNGLPVPGYRAWLSARGVSGAGVTIANVDGGIFDTHPDLVGRMLPCTGDTCGGAATDAHGTHTAAIMAGDAASGVLDANGFLRGLGIAPGAHLVEQVYSPHFQQAGGMLKLMRQSYDNGAQLSGNSWGPAGSPRGYDADTRQVDVGSRDVNPSLAGDQALTYVLSIMNGNGGTSSQGSPDEAKNVITVGSTKAQLSSGAVDANFNDISGNSGHGPALDGRRIPHMVAPGCRVDSAASATGYSLLCGTSMASPQVSGAVALFIEQFRNAYGGRTPSAALSKAALVAATQSLAGFRDADNGVLGQRPDSKQGWGRLRTDWLLAPAAPALYFDQFEVGANTGDLPPTVIFDATGERWDLALSSVDPELPMTLVLTWTDAPGHGLGGNTPAWNNNLDLVVEAAGDSYLGNVLDASGFSTTGGSADARNNIEVVVLPAAIAAGGVNVGVIAAALNSDALPNRTGMTDQDFALACVNCISGSTFGLQADSSRVQACGPATESVDLSLTAIGDYVGSASLSIDSLAGVTSSFSPATVSVPGSSTLSLEIVDPAEGSHPLQILANDGEIEKGVAITLDYSTRLPGGTTLGWPTADLEGVGLRPTLSWTAADNAANSYRLEVSTDADFETLVFALDTEDTHLRLPTALAADTQYWWRVTPSNFCGDAPTSTQRSFRTAEPTCATVAASGLPLSIGPGAAVQTNSTVAIALPGLVQTVSLPTVVGTHTYLGDLSASLLAPDGTAVGFWSRVCGAADDFNFGFDDAATTPFSSMACPATGGLIYRPAAPFSALAGKDAAGSWTLRITDNAGGDGGNLSAWSLRVCAVDGIETNADALFADGFED